MNQTFKLKDFEIEDKVLGTGFMAKIYKAHHKLNGKVYALKAIDLSKAQTAERIALKREEKIHQTLDHPHIVKFYGSFYEDGILYFVLELVEGEELFEYAV